MSKQYRKMLQTADVRASSGCYGTLSERVVTTFTDAPAGEVTAVFKIKQMLAHQQLHTSSSNCARSAVSKPDKETMQRS